MGAGAKPTADDLILRIYDTTVDTSLWPELLQDIAEFCNARGAFIFEIEGDGAERRLNAARYSSIFDPDIVRSYIQLHHDAEMGDQEYFASRSQMSDAIELVPDTEIGTLLDDGESGVHTFDRPHMQMQIQFGFKHRAGALLNKDDLFRDRFALQFSVEHGVANPEDCARAAQIMPHLAKAISLARPSNQLQRRFQSVAQAMDNLKTGVCVLDHDHRAVFHNNEFSRQMDAYRAFRIAPDGKLAFSQDKFDRSLIELFDSPHAHGRFGARPRKEAVASEIGGDNDFALCVEIAPLASAEGFGETTLDGFIVYSLDTSQSYGVRTDTLRALFNLTKSEAAVVELMAEGLTNPQISEQRSKSIHTINSQVKSVLAKTRASNRTQLIRLATNLSATVADEG